MELRVLSQLDAARTQWYHFRAIIIAGMGFFTDAYDLFCIPSLSNLLGRLYYGGTLPPAANCAVNGVALCGLFVGNLFFGRLGDRMGRKKVYGITLILMIGSSIASGFSVGKSRQSVIACLCFFRFWLGVGIGGDYPLSATIMAEYANKKSRGAFMAAVFAMYSVGMLAGGVVAMVVSSCFKAMYPNPTFGQKDIVWRIILMLGAVPAGATLYWRMKIPETARFTALVAKDAGKAAADMSKVLGINITEDEANVSRIDTRAASYGLFSKAFAKTHGRNLLGTMSCWFFLDIAFYSNNLFQKDIYQAVGWLKNSEAYENPVDEVFHIARAQALIALCGTLPGCLITVLLIDRIGRFKIQLFGFLFIAVFIIAMAIPYESYWLQKSHRMGFLTIYSLTFFFSKFGPGSTTFIVPAELFPARLRSTCHGISAAAGKVGGMVGAFGFLYAAQPAHKSSPRHDVGYPTGIGIDKTLFLLGWASFLGFLCTFLIPETMGKSLEENEGDVGESLRESVYDSSIDVNPQWCRQASPVVYFNYNRNLREAIST